VNVSIVTPWHNHLELEDDYMAAMMVLQSGDELVVVDNGSDPPLEFAEVRLPENLGFAGGSNAGLNNATKDAVLFLNNDISIRQNDWLDKIRDALEPGVLVGARLRHDQHGDVDGNHFPYLDGWCLAGMRDDLVDLGGFDTEFQEPAYYSDNDLCLRARLAGMTLREVPVGLYHKASVTTERKVLNSVLEANFERYAARAREAVAV